MLDGEVLVEVSRLGRGITAENSFNNRDFSIILCKEKILSLYFAWINARVVLMAELITLVINCSIDGSID